MDFLKTTSDYIGKQWEATSTWLSAAAGEQTANPFTVRECISQFVVGFSPFWERKVEALTALAGNRFRSALEPWNKTLPVDYVVRVVEKTASTLVIGAVLDAVGVKCHATPSTRIAAFAAAILLHSYEPQSRPLHLALNFTTGLVLRAYVFGVDVISASILSGSETLGKVNSASELKSAVQKAYQDPVAVKDHIMGVAKGIFTSLFQTDMISKCAQALQNRPWDVVLGLSLTPALVLINKKMIEISVLALGHFNIQLTEPQTITGLMIGASVPAKVLILAYGVIFGPLIEEEVFRGKGYDSPISVKNAVPSDIRWLGVVSDTCRQSCLGFVFYSLSSSQDSNPISSILGIITLEFFKAVIYNHPLELTVSSAPTIKGRILRVLENSVVFAAMHIEYSQKWSNVPIFLGTLNMGIFGHQCENIPKIISQALFRIWPTTHISLRV